MKVIGFDYDGTLTNIEPEKAKAFDDILNTEWKVSIPEASDFWLSQGGTSRRFKFDHFYKQQYTIDLPDEVYEEVESKFSQLLREKYYPGIKLLPHIEEVLNFSKNNFGYTFVASGIPEKEIQYLIESNNIGTYFNKVMGTNGIYKTKKDHFEEIKKTTHPTVMLFVGDSAEDMKMAKSSEITAIGLTTNHTDKDLKRAGADAVCDLDNLQNTLNKFI